MMRVTLEQIDVWLMRGMAGLVNMLIRRIAFDHGFGRQARQLFESELKKLLEVREEVAKRAIDSYPCGEAAIDVIDAWFLRSFAGIDSWIQVRSEDGPRICEPNLTGIEEHIEKLRRIVAHERSKA